jgi:hypothetical protein
MIFWAIMFGAALTFLITFTLYLSTEDDEDFNTGVICGVFIILLAIAEVLTIFEISREHKPKAIDVYRNKTELEITSVNGVPRDTVVVWKGGMEK